MPVELMLIMWGPAFILHLAITAALVHKYLLTRDIGVVWLGVAVVLWPLFVLIVQYSGSSLPGGELLRVFEPAIRAALLLIAVTQLHKTKGKGSPLVNTTESSKPPVRHS